MPLIGGTLNDLFGDEHETTYGVRASGADVNDIDSFRVQRLEGATYDGSSINLSGSGSGASYQEDTVSVGSLDRDDYFGGALSMFTDFDPDVYGDVPYGSSDRPSTADGIFFGRTSEDSQENVVYRIEALDSSGDVMADTGFDTLDIDGWDRPTGQALQEDWDRVSSWVPFVEDYDSDEQRRGNLRATMADEAKNGFGSRALNTAMKGVGWVGDEFIHEMFSSKLDRYTPKGVDPTR